MQYQWHAARRHVAAVSVTILALFLIVQLWPPHDISGTPTITIAQPATQTTFAPQQSSTVPSEEPSLPPQSIRPTCDIIKVSMLYGAHKFPQLDAALIGHRRHSERWVCEFRELEHDLTDRKLYSKHYFLLRVLLDELSKSEAERKQWLMWVDADSIVINPAISPEAFLPPDRLPHVFALVTADHQGLNNGVFFLRVHRSSVDLLTKIIDYPLAHPDEDLGWFGEQAAMERVIQATEAEAQAQGRTSGIAWVPRVWFNTFEFESGFEGQPGHSMVHFAGLGAIRIQHMANWLSELENNQSKWEIAIEDTFYAEDIPRYWKDFAANETNNGG